MARGPHPFAVGAVMVIAAGQTMAIRGQEVIDRVLAVVDGQIITLSDTRGVLSLGLAPAPAAGADTTAVTMNRLIDRELMLREVQRYLPAEPSEVEVGRRLDEIRARFPDPSAFEAATRQTGFDVARLTEWIRNDLRIAEYVRERFASAEQVPDSEVDAYFQRHQAELLREGLSMPQALDEARRQLTAQRRDSLVADWLAGLRRRADIIELYLAAQG